MGGPPLQVSPTTSPSFAPWSSSSPPNPETPQAYATHSNLSFSPGPQNQRDPESHTPVGILGVWLIAKDLLLEGSTPTWSVGLEATSPRNCCHVRWWAMVQLGIRYSGPPFKGLLNRDSGLITGGHGKNVCRSIARECVGRRLPEDDFLIDFQHENLSPDELG